MFLNFILQFLEIEYFKGLKIMRVLIPFGGKLKYNTHLSSFHIYLAQAMISDILWPFSWFFVFR